MSGLPDDINDRLISALQCCFTELIKKQEEQTDRIHKAVEALKPQVPVTEEKTAFWNSYMKLADECGKEFQQKYSSDLDAALIFAGLFSGSPCVCSTLFTALLAALLAVLGKQWIMYYQATGSRGTIEERGLDRQRKLDGIRRWRFDLILQIFPMLLQLPLLLFSSALSFYLWSIHRSVAVIILVLTNLGVFTYIGLLVAAIAFPDCPFQTPLAPFLLRVSASFAHFLKQNILVLGFVGLAHSLPFRFLKSKIELLPHFSSVRVREEMAQQAIHCGMAYCTLRFLDRLGGNNGPIQSRFRNIGNLVRSKNNDLVEFTQLDNVFRILKEWPDVPTESSMPEITKWTLYLIPCLDKTKMFNLSAEDSLEYFLHQFDGNCMTNLDHSAFANYLCCVITFLAPMDPGLVAQIDKRNFRRMLMIQLFRTLRLAKIRTSLIARVIEVTARLAARLPEQEELSPSTQRPKISSDVLSEASRFFNSFPRAHGRLDELVSAVRRGEIEDIHELEQTQWRIALDETKTWLRILVLAAGLGRIENPKTMDEVQGRICLNRTPSHRSLERIYMTLEYAQSAFEAKRHHAKDLEEWDCATVLAVDGLLQVLACSPLSEPPPMSSLRVILRALRMPGDVCFSALLVFHQAPAWFFDPYTQEITQKFCLWPELGRVAVKYPELAGERYIALSETVVNIQAWRQIIHNDLASPISVFSAPGWGKNSISRKTFNSLFLKIRVLNPPVW
ncbi:hypothetical protein B0H13DRAFT_2330376 [Mycena leptocephala]|nr:hypothetical protein B0H13DRAFT_2330376 [Mycena leptocephala]